MTDWRRYEAYLTVENVLQAEADRCGLSLAAYIKSKSEADGDFDERRRAPARRLRGNKYVKFKD